MTNYSIGVARFSVGDRLQSKWDKSAICTLIKVRPSGKKPYTIQFDNGRKVHCDELWLDEMIFLEDDQICNNLTSVQELGPVFVTQDSSTDLTSSEPQRLTNTVAAFSNSDIPAYTTTETCEIYQDSQNAELGIICTQEDSTLLQLPHPAPHSPQKANDLEEQMGETVSPVSLKPSENYSQSSQPLKMSQDLSPAPIIQDSPRVHISEEWSEPLTSSGTMRNGWLSEAATLPAPTLESEYCWLRSPGALSLSGKGRPPGQTKQEAELKKLGLINSCEVLNPAILCQWYEIPDSWLDPSESRAATELLEECDRQQEIFSILELQRSPCSEFSTSTQLQRKVSRGDTPPGELCKKSDLALEIFLEETEPATTSTEKSKRRQRKGCLYKYLENKKLKSGDIASYPRVIGHRNPDNPTHWRWGFNWEEKVDGEWKGRSIGSVPLGAIALIQSMQNEGVSLEEIIGFIRRAKAKK